MTDRDNITLHKSDCALLLGGYQCTCGFHQRNSKTLPALAAEPTTQDIEALRRENERLRLLLQEARGAKWLVVQNDLLDRIDAALRLERT